MKIGQTWLVAMVVVALLAGSLSGVFAQNVGEPVMRPMPAPEMIQEVEMNPTDRGEAGGQDYVEPGVTPMMSRDRAVELAREAMLKHLNVDMTKENFQLNTEYRRDWQLADRYVWSLYWHLNDPMGYANANVTLDAATGQILDMSYDRGSYAEPQRQLLTLTREEAQVIADRFINTVMPGKLAEMKLRESPEMAPMMGYGGPYHYTFNYVRMVDGVVYDANFANVTIDGSSSDIKWFSQRWEDRPALPDRTGIITEGEARGTFSDMTALELFYLPLRNEFVYEAMPTSFRLAYRMDPMMGHMINAKTGQPMDWGGRDDNLQFVEKDLSAAEKAAIARSAAPVTSLEQPMGQMEAEETAQNLARQILDREVEIQSANYMEGDQYWESAGRKAWNLDIMVREEEGVESPSPGMGRMPEYSNGRIMVNALTGELIAFNLWQYMEGPYANAEEPVLSWSEGYDRAIEAVKMFHPGRIQQIRTQVRSFQAKEAAGGEFHQPMEYYYHFPRMVNGIAFDENNIAVGVNAQTGKITNYTDRWSDQLILPRPGQAMGEDQAMNRLLANYQLELAYFRYNASDDYMNPQYETKLVYRWTPREAMANYPFIDAATGVPLDYNGRAKPEQDEQGFDARIAGHWVERTARLLAQQGVIDTTLFQPDQPVTRMEAVKMMVKARGAGFYGPMMDMGGDKVEYVDVPEADEDYRYIQWAIRYGYIDNLPEEFQREAKISREEMAVLMVRFMGYRQLAEAHGIFKVNYNDANEISDAALGAVAINLGLGITSDGGAYRPKDETTMAEVADMLFKAVAQQRR